LNRFVAVHGHFYQPPRENPWTGEIDREVTAAPYHDWNERITAECYTPNGSGNPSNYSRMSFNFGPTLLSWLEANAAETYRSILEADGASRERFSGHGSALAQAYNHAILPLANARDKVTQVQWGIRDFEHRFGRRPEGMWLPETAVDEATLEVLAAHGIAFTILSPHQAPGVDPREPCRVPLPSGREIAVFFYDGGVSQAVAFGGLLAGGGGDLARALLSRFEEGDGPSLVHVATDGETYGHHVRGGDRALTEALDAIGGSGWAALTNYGEFLERFPPRRETRILPVSSWSCAHGVGRWTDDCGCSAGGASRHPWRRPLREALDWLRDAIAPVFEVEAERFFAHPWSARDGFVDVLLDPSRESEDRFFTRHGVRNLTAGQRRRALELMELQRNALLMYTSCGWFFDDPAGIETRQVLRYAARAVELAEQTLDAPLEPLFLRLLERVRSGRGDGPDAASIYRTLRSPHVPAEPAIPH
jgi:alpha-amylase/alpha-mannosidase (GH57 family)